MHAYLPSRPRRNRRSAAIRSLVRETRLSPENLILPLFIQEGKDQKTPIKTLPHTSRLSIDLAIQEVKLANKLGIQAIALFPVVPDSKKDATASESRNPEGLLPQAIREIKSACPDVALITDVAMDPYSSDGHDGLVQNGKILNDETLEILAEMSLLQARSGADFVAPSDMMDGRVGYIRDALDAEGFTDTGILAYSAKYASCFYGPFRDALGSAPKAGDKKTYQMDPANAREALREAALDEEEGADILMVKPALAYLDIIAQMRQSTALPIAAYQVSGEFAMLAAASQAGILNFEQALMETLTAIRRAGADQILTYGAVTAAQLLND